MEQALEIDLVLERVLQYLPYKDLKNVRLVNKYFNELAKFELRKCSRNTVLHRSNYDDFCRLEASLEDKNLVASLPVFVRLQFRGFQVHQDWDLVTDVLVNQPWRMRVTSLELDGLSIAEVNRLLKFVLQQLPSLKSLTVYDVLNSDVDSTPEDLNTRVVPLTTEAVFPLRYFYMDFSGYTIDSKAIPFDPSFLLQCKSLKDFHAEIFDSSETFLRFFERWELLLNQYPELSRFKQLKFSVNVSDDDENMHGLRDAISKFINLNQPTSLKLSGKFDFCYQTLLPPIRSPIGSLTVAVPINEQRNYCSWWLLQVLKKCTAFTRLQELCLILQWQSVEHASTEEALFNCNKHNLSTVKSLSINVDNGLLLEPYVLKDIAQYLLNITQLKLSGLFCDTDICGAELDWKDVFDGIQEFSSLRELFIEVTADGNHVLSTVRNIHVEKSTGYFSRISRLSGLRKFSATLDGPSIDLSPSDSFDLVLVGFFSGSGKCAPDMRLILDVTLSEKQDYRIRKSYTMDQFELEMEGAGCRCYELLSF